LLELGYGLRLGVSFRGQVGRCLSLPDTQARQSVGRQVVFERDQGRPEGGVIVALARQGAVPPLVGVVTGVPGFQLERRGGLVVLCGGGAEHGVGVAGLAERGRRGDHDEAIDGGVELADRGWILVDDDPVGDGGCSAMRRNRSAVSTTCSAR
jgi:hypothetical protein